MPDADLNLAVPAVFFGAVGTAGQRCTSTRRLYLHSSIVDKFLSRLDSLYQSVRPGDPLDRATLLGPLHTRAAVGIYTDAIDHLKQTGAEILTGGAPYRDLASPLDKGNFVMPTIAIPQEVNVKARAWSTETFAPVLNVGVFDELEQAIEWNNGVPQGLSSSLWTRDIRNVGKWIGPAGSDAGIVNVNVGTSGAEIGAAFGGNKVSVSPFPYSMFSLGVILTGASSNTEHGLGSRVRRRCVEAVRALERCDAQLLGRGTSRARRAVLERGVTTSVLRPPYPTPGIDLCRSTHLEG